MFFTQYQVGVTLLFAHEEIRYTVSSVLVPVLFLSNSFVAELHSRIRNHKYIYFFFTLLVALYNEAMTF